MGAPRSFVEEYAHLPVIDLAYLRERREQLWAAARCHGVARLWVFGSVARGEARPDSDVDFAVELLPDARPRWALGGLYADLQDAVDGRRIDLVELHEGTRSDLRAEIERDAVEL